MSRFRAVSPSGSRGLENSDEIYQARLMIFSPNPPQPSGPPTRWNTPMKECWGAGEGFPARRQSCAGFVVTLETHLYGGLPISANFVIFKNSSFPNTASPQLPYCRDGLRHRLASISSLPGTGCCPASIRTYSSQQLSRLVFYSHFTGGENEARVWLPLWSSLVRELNPEPLILEPHHLSSPSVAQMSSSPVFVIRPARKSCLRGW